MRMGFLADKFSGNAPKMDIYFFRAFSYIVCGAYHDLRRNKHNSKLTMTQVTASLGIPMSMIYVIVPICGIFVILFGVIKYI